MLGCYYKSSQKIGLTSRRTINKSGNASYQNPNNTNNIEEEPQKVATDFNEGYKEFKNATTSVAGSLNIQTAQYQFGIGLVF